MKDSLHPCTAASFAHYFVTAEPERSVQLDDTDWALIRTTQEGLPLVLDPYGEIATNLGLTRVDVMARLQRLQELAVIRRIGVIPNHYALGFRFNGMSVWDVADEDVDRLGPKIGALSFVSHCYRRPRHLPEWPYNLFAMLHAVSRDQVEAMAEEVRAILGDACRRHDILYSTKLLKKTGLRLPEPDRRYPKSSCPTLNPTFGHLNPSENVPH